MSVLAVEQNTPLNQLAFRRKVYVDEIDTNKFLQESFQTDNLIIFHGQGVAGKGLQSSLAVGSIYAEQGNDQFMFTLGASEEDKRYYNEIPSDLIFVFIDDAEDVFVIAEDDLGGKSVYRLPEDVIVAVYLETQLYKKRNRFYACAIRDLKQKFCFCKVTSDPRTGELLFRFFSSEIDFE